MVLCHACLILSAFCLNIHSRPFDQILWILLFLFIYHSLFHLSGLILLLTRPFNKNTWSSFIYFVFCCARPFDHSTTDLFYLYTTIRQKHMALFYLFFLLCTTMRPKIRSLIDLFFYVHTTIRPKYVVFLYLLFLLCTTIRARVRVLTDLFLLFAHDHSTKIYGPLLFILYFVHDHSTKN